MNSVDSLKTIVINNNETSETNIDTSNIILISNSNSNYKRLFMVIVSFLCAGFIGVIIYLLIRYKV